MSLFIGTLAFEHGNFDLLAGVKMGVLIGSLISAIWGLVVLNFTLPKKLQELYSGFGIDLQRFNGNDSWELPLPARFLVDSKGIIRSTEVHPDHTLRPEPTEIIDFVKSVS